MGTSNRASLREIGALALGLVAFGLLACGNSTPSNAPGEMAGGGSGGGAAGQMQQENPPVMPIGTDGGVGGAGGSAGSGGMSGASGAGGSGGMAGTADAGPVKHRFLSSVARPGPMAIVSAAGDIEWQVPIDNEANDAWLLPSGNVTFAYLSGAREITHDKQVVWDYPAPSGSEIHSCQPLDNGHYLIGEAHGGGVGYFRELDNTGKVVSTVTVQADATLSGHAQFRQVRKTPQNTYLTIYQALGKAREIDAKGQLMREFPCGSFVALRLPDQNTLIACGDDHRVIEVDPQNNIVWEVKERDIPGNVLGFAAGLQRLANGNTVIANWPGHGGDMNQPQVFEITRNKQVVWELKKPELKWITTIEILDADAAVNGKMLR